jgi:holin-like protein
MRKPLGNQGLSHGPVKPRMGTRLERLAFALTIALYRERVAAPPEAFVKKKLQFLGQVALLSGIYYLGNQIADFAHLPVPGNVVGVVLLYALLNLGLVPLEYVQDAADFLLKHLVFFFIPVAVDLMNWGGIFYRYGLALALAIVLSTILTFLGTGYIAQWLQKHEKTCPS